MPFVSIKKTNQPTNKNTFLKSDPSQVGIEEYKFPNSHRLVSLIIHTVRMFGLDQ